MDKIYIIVISILSVIILIPLIMYIVFEVSHEKKINKERENKVMLGKSLINKRDFITDFVNKYNEIVNDKNNILNDFIVADKDFYNFISHATTKYNMYLRKWYLEDRVEKTEKFKGNLCNMLYEEYYIRWIEQYYPWRVTEINEIYSDFSYIWNKLATLGINYYDTELTDLNRKIEKLK